MTAMNLADPQLELIDPTPNVHALFIQFDKIFFSTKLASRAVVRWSKRMYSCAGICSYEGRGGLCDIALSEPLLKLRPRKDLIETLLHEMIHAFLFVTNRDQDRDGHGPNFRAHMHRINQSAGLNISVYHDFHDEVKLYQTHWWRCTGPCQKKGPHFGIVRRNSNRAPGPKDYWWKDHKFKCGGTFEKIKAPEPKRSTKGKSGTKTNKNITSKGNGDILKYINNNNVTKGDSVGGKVNSNTSTNNINTLVSSAPPKSVPVFTGNGYKINTTETLVDSRSVTEHVRNIWANKQISIKANNIQPNSSVNSNKHKNEKHILSPPAKVKKIDDYFKAEAILKDLYGEDCKMIKPRDKHKTVSSSDTNKSDIISCPICSIKIDHKCINKHLDECLNRGLIEKLSQEDHNIKENITNNRQNVIVTHVPVNNNIDVNLQGNKRRKTDSQLECIDVYKDKSVPTQISGKKASNTEVIKRRKTNNFLTLERGDTISKEIFPENMKTEPQNIKAEPSSGKSHPNTTKDNTTGVTAFQIVPVAGTSNSQNNVVQIKSEPDIIIKEPSGKNSDNILFSQKCPCCGKKFDKPVEDHLDECLAFVMDDSMVPIEGANTSSGIIIIDDVFDESLTLNATGTKTPCPCCMIMVEHNDMNDHLDVCLGIKKD